MPSVDGDHPDAEKLEARKLELEIAGLEHHPNIEKLEERKLELEIKDLEHPPDAEKLEARKLELEIADLEHHPNIEKLEERKLELEIEDLERPWYKDVELLGKAFSIPIGIAGLLIGFYFSNLQKKVDVLTSQEDSLKQVIQASEQKKKDLEGAKVSLESERARLATDVSTLRAQLEEKAFRDRLELLTSRQNPRLETGASSFHNLSPQSVEIARILRQDSARRTQYVTELKATLAKTDDPFLRAELLGILWQGTHDSQWLRQIVQEFDGLVNPKLEMPIKEEFQLQLWVSSIGSNLPSSTRASVGRSLVARLVSTKLPDWRQILVLGGVFGLLLPRSQEDLDEQSLDPYVNGLAIARQIALNKHTLEEDRLRALYQLRNMSREALLVTVAELLEADTTDEDTRERLEEFAISFPHGLKTPHSADADEWEDWTEKNQDLMSLYSDKWLDKLREKIKRRR